MVFLENIVIVELVILLDRVDLLIVVIVIIVLKDLIIIVLGLGIVQGKEIINSFISLFAYLIY